MKENKMTNEEIEEAIAQNKKVYENNIKTMRIILDKYPKIEEAPRDVQNQYDSLHRENVYIVQSNREKNFVKAGNVYLAPYYVRGEAYNSIKSDLTKNAAGIKKEDYENIEFPKIDFNTINNEIENMKNIDDYWKINDKINEYRRLPFPEDTREKLDELENKFSIKAKEEMKNKDWNSPSFEKNISSEKNSKENKSLAKVNKSKLAQIYSKAKNKIKDFFDRSNKKGKEENIKGKGENNFEGR